MYTIVPFERYYQSEIDELMNEIQKEFELPFRSPDPVPIFEYVLSGNLFWVALLEEQVIGTIGLSCFDDKTGVIRNMFVAKEHRGGQPGVAKQLLDTALEAAKRLGYNAVYLGTMMQFKAAQKFYSKNNFVLIPRTDLPEGMTFNPVDDLFYVLKFENN
ncbi:MAG: GCN5-related N-acetyltransferase [Fluviicola sp.]|jgi:GNAT superfamily N-acetyltransferase|uniref:GNAT family N-acetyltransferase n=1 Tax=Fluviicola sp. TaxID=1917219 RepID=UPI0026224E28|nr:GNAT family N-acetyltransferase [Fluviicola sp.]MDF3026050.1 GCN5-related N-acetyltransferase [Fluviicola sp.]